MVQPEDESSERRQNRADEFDLEREAKQKPGQDFRNMPVDLSTNQQQAEGGDCGREGWDFQHARSTQLNKTGRGNEQGGCQSRNEKATNTEADEEHR